jgi:hypothetical protein
MNIFNTLSLNAPKPSFGQKLSGFLVIFLSGRFFLFIIDDTFNNKLTSNVYLTFVTSLKTILSTITLKNYMSTTVKPVFNLPAGCPIM